MDDRRKRENLAFDTCDIRFAPDFAIGYNGYMDNLTPISGIHHLTAIASDPQRNLDFYTKTLGLRLVKRTVSLRARCRVVSCDCPRPSVRR